MAILYILIAFSSQSDTYSFHLNVNSFHFDGNSPYADADS